MTGHETLSQYTFMPLLNPMTGHETLSQYTFPPRSKSYDWTWDTD